MWVCDVSQQTKLYAYTYRFVLQHFHALEYLSSESPQTFECSTIPPTNPEMNFPSVWIESERVHFLF